jgi:hypothetical protein
VRQRNDSGHALHVSAWPTEKEPDRAPFDVGPGEEKDFPTLLAGFTSLEPAEPDEPDEPQDESDDGAAVEAKPKPRGKAAAKTDSAGGGSQ